MIRVAYSVFFIIVLSAGHLGSLEIPPSHKTHETLDIYLRLTQLNIFRGLGYSDQELFLISTYIETSARHYDINQYLMIALFDVESKLGTQKLRFTKGRATDFGWGQIHIQHLKTPRFDRTKLIEDTQYSIEVAFYFMKDIKKRYGSREKSYYTRYHSYTPFHRQKYYKLLKDSAYLISANVIEGGFQEIKPDPLLCEFKNDGRF